MTMTAPRLAIPEDWSKDYARALEIYPLALVVSRPRRCFDKRSKWLLFLLALYLFTLVLYW